MTTFKKQISKKKRTMKGGAAASAADAAQILAVAQAALVSKQADLATAKGPADIDTAKTAVAKAQAAVDTAQAAVDAAQAAVPTAQAAVAAAQATATAANPGFLSRRYTGAKGTVGAYGTSVNENRMSTATTGLLGASIGLLAGRGMYKISAKNLNKGLNKEVNLTVETLTNPSNFANLNPTTQKNKESITNFLEKGANIVPYLPDSILKDSNFINELVSNRMIKGNAKKELVKLQRQR